jgi:hypothetical protein
MIPRLPPLANHKSNQIGVGLQTMAPLHYDLAQVIGVKNGPIRTTVD